MSFFRATFVACFVSSFFVGSPVLASAASDDQTFVASGGGGCDQGGDESLALSIVAGATVLSRRQRKS